MNIEKKIDHRKKYYMVLDCETATLPFVNEFNNRDKIAIAKPLIYDIAWTVFDRNFNTYRQKHYLISEIFSVPSIFNTAYYKEKRPIYIDLLNKGEINLCCWETAMADFINDLAEVESVGAYNSMFDYKKAITFTERYIKALYSENGISEFERKQRYACKMIEQGKAYENEFDPYNFIFRDKKYPLFDIWGIACENILNSDDFRQFCEDNEFYSASKKYYSTTAETCYRFITDNIDFNEAHTALDDVLIEMEILAKAINKNPKKIEIGIIYFPFKIVGSRSV